MPHLHRFLGFLAMLFFGCGCVPATQNAALHSPPLADADLHVDVHNPDKAYQGTTLLVDNHRENRPRILELDMDGRIAWEYVIPSHLSRYTNPGFDVERLSNGHVLFVLPLHGIYEINRAGDVVWKHLDKNVTHDADRLPNGNTLYVFGGFDGKSDAQVKEVDPQGRMVWSWKAADHFDTPAYRDISDQGWTHTNAVTRCKNGHTLISLRNFNIIAEVDASGALVRAVGQGLFHYQHDPEILPNGHLLVMNHKRPNQALEIDPKTDRVYWESRPFEKEMSPVRDANLLPNGNILITGSTRILELTRENEVVWCLNLDVIFKNRRQAPALGFYKAERY